MCVYIYVYMYMCSYVWLCVCVAFVQWLSPALTVDETCFKLIAFGLMGRPLGSAVGVAAIPLSEHLPHVPAVHTLQRKPQPSAPCVPAQADFLAGVPPGAVGSSLCLF